MIRNQVRNWLGLAGLAMLIACGAGAQTLIDEWPGVKPPAAPVLKPAIVDPRTTALLLMDFTNQTCTTERRPRCAASVPKLVKLMNDARARNMMVIYSVPGSGATSADILKELALKAGDPVLPPLGPDKFIGSEFEKALRDRNITTLIVTGTAAHTSVLHTGGEAVLRGFKIIVPVDGMSSNDAFPELYTAWHLVNAARISDGTTLTKTDMITYGP